MNPDQIPKPKIAEDINARQAILNRLKQSGVSVEEVAKMSKKHRSTVYRMKKRSASGESIIDKRLLSTGMPSKVDDLRAGWVLAFLAAHQGAPIAVACRELNKVAEGNGWPQTNYFGLVRYLDKLPADLRRLLSDGSTAMLEKSMPVGRRENYRLLELVQADFTELPIWTVDMADGSLFKPYMSGIIDAASRVPMGIRIHRKVPDAIEVVAAVRKAFLPKDDPAFPFWGVAEVFQCDNAGVFVGTQLAGAALRTGFVVDPIAVGQPEENGKIERFFGTFARGFLSRLQGYADQSSGLAKAKKGAIPFPVLERLAWRYLLEYCSSVHSELGCTPWEKWHDLVGAASGRLFPRKHIRDGMRVELEGNVTREGISIDGRYYNGTCLNGLVGDKITILATPGECDQIVPAYHRGTKIGRLQLANQVADEINAGRLDRAKRLMKFRKDLSKKLDEMPQVDHPETVVPAEVNKATKVARDKKTKESTSTSTRLEREPC